MIEIEWISDLVITDYESDNRQDAVYKNIWNKSQWELRTM